MKHWFSSLRSKTFFHQHKPINILINNFLKSMLKNSKILRTKRKKSNQFPKICHNHISLTLILQLRAWSGKSDAIHSGSFGGFYSIG